MTYETAIGLLQSELASASIRGDVVIPESGSVPEPIFSSMAASISRFGYPNNVTIPYLSEDLRIYNLEDLVARQVGYRSDTRSGHKSSDWDENMWVLGDWSANPYCINRDGSIWFAFHGRGKWSYVPIANDISIFFSVLARWMNFYVKENKKNIFDEDFNVYPEKISEIYSNVASDLTQEQREGFVESLGI